MTSVWLLCAAEDVVVGRRLGVELADRGVSIVGTGLEHPAAAADSVVVLLSGASLPDESLRWAREWDDRVVPVSIDGEVHPEFGETNQIMLTTVGYAAAAAQIVAVATVGGRTLAGLRELFGVSQGWDRSGRRRAGLLSTRDQFDDARALIAACPPAMSQDLAVEYLDASGRQLRRRARAVVTVGTLVALILVSATIVAVVQRRSSASAADRLDREAQQETSKRLASLSRSLLDVDPDLSRLAAAEALHQDPGPEAAAAAREALIQSLGHRSFALDVLPNDVTVGGDFFAVVDVDGAAQLHDVSSGELLRRIDLSMDLDNAELSADGAHLALFGPEGFEILSTADGHEERSGTASFGIWADDVLVTDDDGVLESQLVGDEESPLALPETDGPVSAFAMNADLSMIAVIADDEVVVSSLDDGRQVWSGPAAGAIDVEFAPSGELFIVGTDTWHVVDDPMADDAEATDAGIVGLPLVRPLTRSGLVALGTDDGIFNLVYGFQSDYGSPTLLDGRAHQGTAIALATIPGGGFATAGGDRYVRLWDEPSLPSAVAGRPFAEYWPRVDPANREGYRPVLALSPDESVVSVSQGSPALVSRVDAETLTLRTGDGTPQSYLGDIVARAQPCGDEGVYFYAQGLGSAEVLNLVTGDEDVLPDISDPAPGGVNSAHLGCSADGSEVGWADSSSLRFLDVESGSWTSTPVIGDGAPVSVLAASAPLSIALRNGERLSSDGARSRLTPDGVGAVAAGDSPDRRFVAVGTDGGLYLSTPDAAPRQLGVVSQDLEAYAVRVSPNGRLAAVIGDVATEIYDTRTGALFLSLTSGAGEFRKSVRDVLFVGDDLVTIDEVGALARYELPTADEVADALLPASRDVTATERDLVFELDR